MMQSHGGLGSRVMDIVDEINRFSDDPAALTRLYLSPSHKAAAARVVELMQAAGMTAAIDAAGSVAGRYRGTDPSAAPVLVGSHIDTVVNAGRYDGNLGVACGIAVIEDWARKGVRLPFPVDVIAFGDEENVRFPTNFSTSLALVGAYDPAWLDGADETGVTLRAALEGFGDEGAIPGLSRLAQPPRAYLEVHIEQGPVLEAEGRAVGIVTAIAGITRARIRLTGEAGHAGTVPMAMRKDALAAAAEMISAVERIGGMRPDTVATVGVCKVDPGAVNVVPAAVDLALDARAPDDSVREPMVAAIHAEMVAIASRRGIGFSYDPFMDSPATVMDEGLVRILERAATPFGPPRRLASGAGHDAVAIARLCPAAMLFVRCAGGISHNPAEAITTDDADIAARVLRDAVEMLAGATG